MNFARDINPNVPLGFGVDFGQFFKALRFRWIEANTLDAYFHVIKQIVGHDAIYGFPI